MPKFRQSLVHARSFLGSSGTLARRVESRSDIAVFPAQNRIRPHPTRIDDQQKLRLPGSIEADVDETTQ